MNLAKQYKTRRSASVVVNDTDSHKWRYEEILGIKRNREIENKLAIKQLEKDITSEQEKEVLRNSSSSSSK